MYVCVFTYPGEMSVEKQATVKSELSPDGGLKLTIKREKTAEDACKPEWVTEARGSGLGKLVIKRKSPTSVSKSLKTAGLHVDQQTEQRPALRLSITSSASSDGNRHAHVKSWSSCEVSSAVEDVASASELSPTCPLQQSPKDSGVDMSSPPHDDGAVCVEPGSGTGMWSATDSHNGDSSAIEIEKMTGSLEKLETAVNNFVHADNTVHSRSKILWPDTMSHSCESNHPKVQSTLRSRGERSVLKSIASSSQKLVNPLAKSCRVGRYQHMLPVHRIRAEANVARRSSLEESPTYNMVTSRTSLLSGLPRVKTKLKLLSNNTYAPVFDQETEGSGRHGADQKTKCLNVEKSTSKVVERKRNRLSCKSSASGAFENLKVKLSFGSKHRRGSHGDDGQKLPKLKLVVKSEPSLSVSCIEQRLEAASVSTADKQAEENVPRRVRRKRRQREGGKMKFCSNNASVELLPDVDHFSANQLPSFVMAGVRNCHTKRRSLEAKQVADWEPSEKKSKMQSSAEEHLSDHPPDLLSVSQHSTEEDCVNKSTSTVQSVDCDASTDKAVCGEALNKSSIHTDKLSSGQSSVCDASSKAHSPVPLEAGILESASVHQTSPTPSSESCVAMNISSMHTDKLSSGQSSVCDASSKALSPVPLEAGILASALVDQTMSCTASSESCVTGAIHSNSIESDREKCCDAGFNFDSAKCTASDFVNVNADHDADTVDWQCADKLPLPDDNVHVTKEDMPTALEHASSPDCSATCDDVVVPDKPCMTINSVSADDQPTEDTSGYQSGKMEDTCAVFDENSISGAVELLTAVCTNSTDTEVPLLSSPVLDNCDYVNTDCTELLPDSNGSDVTEAEDTNLLLTLKPAVVTQDVSSCTSVCTENCIDVVDKICSVDSVKLDCQGTECQQDIKQQMVDTKVLCENNFDFKSVYSASDQTTKPGDGCEQMVSGLPYLDIPSNSMPLSAPCFSKEQKEIPVASGTSSNGFLAAFTQFVSAKKKSTKYKVLHGTDSTSESTDEILLKPGCSKQCVRRKPFTSQRRRSTCSKHTALENRSPHHVAHDPSVDTDERVTIKEASVSETGSTEDVDSSERLCAATAECSTLRRDELLNVVASDCQLVTLRHRVCELLETVVPELQFPAGFRRDSASVERFVEDITDILSSSEGHVQDIERCSDPVVTLMHMPDRCLQSLQRLVIRLLPLLLPDTDLSDIDGDSVDIFLELMTSFNRPSPGTSCSSQSNLHLSPEQTLQPLNKLQPQGPLSSLCHADADVKCEQIDALSRPESHMTAVDTLFNIPSSLLQINSPGPVGEKRSIRRQVKDCLMLLDRDLT